MASTSPHSCPPEIGPSVLASDLSRLAEEVAHVEASGADYIHLDVMDGHFVPNISFGAPVIKGLRQHTKAVLDAHLMVTKPQQWVEDMAKAGVDRLTFHLESDCEPSEVINAIKGSGMKVGMAIKPATPVEGLLQYCDQLDLALIMTVEPGFGGQSFMQDQMSKVKAIREKFPGLAIEVDGGLNADSIDQAAEAGANLIVAGSYVFKGDRAEKISTLRRAVERLGNGKAEEDLSPLHKDKS